MKQQDNKIQLNVGDFVKYECGAMTDEIKLDHIDSEGFFVNKSGGKGFLYLKQITHINSEAVDWRKITVSDNIKNIIGIKIDINAVTTLITNGDRQNLASILDKIDHSWSEMIYLKSKEQSDIAAGKSFKMSLVNLESNKVSTIGKGYSKNRSTEPKLVNPNDPNLLRLFTPEEHARIKGFSPKLIDGLPNTTAHEVLGNGVVRQPIQALGRIIGEQLISLI